jgi:hypothetical protein
VYWSVQTDFELKLGRKHEKSEWIHRLDNSDKRSVVNIIIIQIKSVMTEIALVNLLYSSNMFYNSQRFIHAAVASLGLV